MAPSDQDPEIELRKDKAFERILIEALSSGVRKAECPDAETLAAFYERALAPAETSHWRGHFAGCPRCQQALAAMAASDPNPLAEEEVARLGELVAAASAPPVAAPRPRTLKWPWYFDPRTLVPLAAAAVFVGAIWLAVRSPRVTPQEVELSPASSTAAPLVAENKPAPPPSPALSGSSITSPASQAPAQQAAPISAPPPPPTPAPQQPLTATSDSVGAAAPAPSAQSQASEQISASQAPVAGTGAQSPSEEADKKVTAAAPAENPAPEGSAEQSTIVAAQSNQERLSTLVPSAGLMRPQDKVASAGATVAAKTNSQVVWRFGSAGRIERSTDGGATWMPQSSPIQTELLAGSAPSETICWLVGGSGAILLSTDGATWVQVPSPKQAEQNAQAPDWSSVKARNARSAIIRSADGRRFSTSDAGKTWQSH
jgi:hypothetical protein